MKYLHRIFSILLIAGMMLGWTASGTTQAKSVQPQASAVDKFDAQVVQDFRGGLADFFIILTEQADVSHAAQLKTKAEKGQFVYETLVATANRTQAGLKAVLDNQGVSYRSYYIFNGILVKAGTYDLALAIAERDDVARITANYKFKLEEPYINKNSPVMPNGIGPNVSFIKADQVWAMGFTGQGTVMAGNDTGLDVTHPAIARHYRGCLNPPECTQMDHNYNWYDAYNPSNVVPWDDYDHGTHTTGTMVGDDGGENRIGVAPGATTIHCKNMQYGNGDSEHFNLCFEWDLAPWDLTGANPRPDLAPDAINNSWGMPGGGDDSMRTSVLNLQAAGILVEVSAGNEGPSCSTLRSPGDYAEVLTTGAVDYVGLTFPGIITVVPGWWSTSRGPSDLDGNYFPDIMAPGNEVRSSVPGNQYVSWGGTSMAGPHATALVGLMWSANPALKGLVEQTIDIIRETAGPLTGQNGSNCGGNYSVGPNNDWGKGTIDAQAAVLAAIAFGSAGTLQGTVTDANTSLPIAGVTIDAVRQEGGSYHDVTGADGTYQFTVAAGTFDITASHLYYHTGIANDIVVPEDGTVDQNFSLDPLAIYTVSGHVREAGTNIPIENAQVEVLELPLDPILTDPTGFYSLEVPEGAWTFNVSAADHGPQTVVVNVSGNTQQDFSLALFCDVLNDTVENGNIGWTAQTPWAITQESAHSQTHSWTDSPGGNYNNYVNTSLTSPLLDLTDYTGMSLSFWQTYATEIGWDYAYVEFSTNGGSSWTAARTYNGTNMTWTNQEIALPQLDDQPNARIRFHFTSDVSVVYDGWHVDDITLVGSGPACLPEAALSLDPSALEQPGEPGTEVDFSFTLTNVGSVPQDVTPSVAAEWPTVVTPDLIEALEPGETADVVVTVSVPATLDKLSDTFTLTASGSEGSLAYAEGTTTADVNLAVEVTDPADGSGAASRLVAYEFTLTNTGDYTDAYTLAAEGLWGATLPGGDSTGPVAPGASVSVTVLVAVPVEAAAGESDVTTLTVTSTLDPDLTGSADVSTMAAYMRLLPVIVK